MEEDWNPIAEDFNSTSINSYNQGAGANMPMDYLPQHKKSNNGAVTAISLYVCGLPRSFDESSLKNMFAQYGKVRRVHIGQAKTSPLKLKYGFVDFETLKEAEQAIAGLNNKVLDSHPLSVAFSRNMQDKLRQQTLELGEENIQITEKTSPPQNNVSQNFKNYNYQQNQSPGFNKSVEITDFKNLRVVVPNASSPISNGRNNHVNTQYYLSQNHKKRLDLAIDNATATGLGFHLNHLVNGNNFSDMPITDTKPQVCEVCDNLAFFICGQCKSTWYCSQNCQFDDWLEHRIDCVGNRSNDLRTTKINEILYPSSDVSPTSSHTSPISSSNNENQSDTAVKRYPMTVGKPSGNYKDRNLSHKPVNQNSVKGDANLIKPLRRPKNLRDSANDANGASNKAPALVIPPSVLTCGSLTVGQDLTLILVWKEASTLCFNVLHQDILRNVKDIQNKLNNDHVTTVLPLKSVSKGDIVTALSPDDNCWYRACVISTGDKNVQVYYVDYGNTETVESVKKLSVSEIAVPSCLLIVKSDGLPDDFKKISVGSAPQGRLISLSKSKVTIEVTANNSTSKTQLICFPWNHELELSETIATQPIIKETIIDTNVESFKDDLTLTVNSLSPNDDGDSVYVVFITSTDELFLQKTSEAVKMDELSDMIRDYCLKYSEPNKIFPKEGCYVCAHLKDDGYYRAKVLSTDKKMNVISVFLVDTGKRVSVNIVDIKPLPLGAYSNPAFAYAASLHLVPKLTDEQKTLLTSKEWKLKVECAAKGPLKYPEVRLFDEKLCVNDFINQHLPPLNDESSVSRSPNNISGATSAVLQSKTLSNTNELLNEKSAALKIESKSVMVDDIPKSKLAVSQKAKLFINHYENSHLIFCISLDDKAISDFQNLSEKILIAASNIQPNSNFRPVVGQVVLAKYSADDSWYRGVTLDIDGETALLFFVDYGNFETVNFKEMVPLPPSFSSIPSQVVTTALNGIKPREEWSSDDVAQLKEIFVKNGNTIDCYVESYNDMDNVYLISIESPDINDFLTSKNLKIVAPSAGDTTVDQLDMILKMKQQIEQLKIELAKAKQN